MNTFIYEDRLSYDGDEWFDVCYPIKTEMSKDDLISHLQFKAEEFLEQNPWKYPLLYPKEDIFYPFGNKDYPMSVSSFLRFKGINLAPLTPIEKWEGVTI